MSESEGHARPPVPFFRSVGGLLATICAATAVLSAIWGVDDLIAGRTELHPWTVAALAVIAGLIGLALAVCLFLVILVGSLIVWPATIIAVLIGGFAGGGAGALVGWVLAGLGGLGFRWWAERFG